MLIYIDCEGEPVQEFSGLYVDEDRSEIVDVFHKHVIYPFHNDHDYFARRHIHGLKRNFLSEYGLCSQEELLSLFHEWLKSHPFNDIYAHAPAKEIKLLSLPVKDVCLKPWKYRTQTNSHQISLGMKLAAIPVNGITCVAHDYVKWKTKCKCAPSATDIAKMHFNYHCSLYDCVECFLFHIEEK